MDESTRTKDGGRRMPDPDAPHPGRDETDLQQSQDVDALDETGPEPDDPGAEDLRPGRA